MNFIRSVSPPFDKNSGSNKFPILNNRTLYHQSFLIGKVIESSLPNGISIVDETGRQIYINQPFCKMVGWTESELIGQYPPFIYWSPGNIQIIERAFQQTLDGEAPDEGFDLIFIHKNGQEIAVNVLISIILQVENHKFFLAHVTDLSTRNKSIDELSRSMLMLSSSIESLKDTIIFSTDSQHRYLYFNKVHYDTMKHAYDTEIEIGMNMLDCITIEDDRNIVKENLEHALSGESISFIQTLGDVNRDYYECYFNPVFNEENEIIGCSAIAKNINDRISAEQTLRDSETKLREIINQVNDIIVVFDNQGRIIIWNSGAEKICGLPAKEVLNKNIIDIEVRLLAPPLNDRSRIEKTINGIITLGTPERFNQILESEIIPINSNKILNIQSIVFPIKLKAEYLFCTVIRDITEMKRYEKEILKVSTEKDKFYAIIAQQLYTPFNVFANFTKLIDDELDNLPIKEIQKMVTMMRRSATNLYSVLDNLLQWTKIHQGKIIFEPQTFNLKRVCIESTSVLKQDADSKNIIITHNASDEIQVTADLFMLKTIFRNLVYYVIKFSDYNGQIDINAQENNSYVTISITGKGSGLNTVSLKQLFDARQIYSAFGETEEQGTILGLMLSKQFVEINGGKIWAENFSGNSNGINFILLKG